MQVFMLTIFVILVSTNFEEYQTLRQAYYELWLFVLLNHALVIFDILMLAVFRKYVTLENREKI